MAGSFGKMLIIDLTKSDIAERDIGVDVFNNYLGGKGLGTHLLMKMLPPGVDPLSPDNIVVLTTGPATDTVLSPASRFGLFSKSPATGAYAESYSGGHLPPQIKRTGFDAIVITGRASRPCFIGINENGVNFYDAGEVWGLETYDAEEALKKAVGTNKAQALVIGPAGETQICFACLKNNRWRSAGRAGLGAVFGSKNLKGIVFGGETRAAVYDEEGLAKWHREFVARSKDSPSALTYRQQGTPSLVAITNKAGCFPTRYWTAGSLKGWEKISAQYMQENMEVKSRGCYRCFFACGKLTTVLKGRHCGLTVEGPEYETIYAFGGLCCITEMEEILYLNDLCDRWGIDTISAGNIAAFAIEAGSKGRLREAPSYGDPDSIASFLQKVIEGSGEGVLFQKGIREAALDLEMDDVAVHVKGLEPAGYDPRVLKGMGLAYATSDRGACHLRTTFYKPELSGMIDPATTEGKARLFIDFEDRLNIYDCLIFCRFYRDLIHWEGLIAVLYYLTGIRYSIADLKMISGRIQNLTRFFNLREGLTREDDTLPEKLLKESINNAENSITPKELEQMLDEYYLLRGWDERGVPTMAKQQKQ
ncbi:MAG: aldehyde ferredoxin oxidoreductase family protein [Bacillota bacterium]|nr:aldehyde ferredoxin oxidoreductase family protein [Bacillota bacterium]